MNSRIATSLLAALLVLAPAAASHAVAQSAGTPTAASTAKKLTRAELDALLAQPDRALLLDVRRPDELISIGGFPAYLSIQAADLEKQLRVIPRDRVIVTVSNHANRALRAADLLSKNGFTVAGAIGAQDYEGQGGSLVKSAQPQPRAAQGQASGSAAAPAH